MGISAAKRSAKTQAKTKLHAKKSIDKKKHKKPQPNKVDVTLRVSVKTMRGLVVAAISHEQATSAAEREAIKKAVWGQKRPEGDLLPLQAGERAEKCLDE